MARDFKSRFILTGEDRAAAAFASVEKTAGRTLAKFAAFAGIGLSIDAVIDKTKQALTQFDNIAKTADKIGITTGALQELRHAADLSNVSVEQMDKALTDFVRRTGEAVVGTGSARDEFQRLGISLRDSSGQVKAAEDLFNEVVQALQGVESQTERARIAYNLFGRAGVSLTNLTNEGAKGIAAMREEARELGLVVDEHTLRSAEELNDELVRQQKIIDTQLSEAFVALGPVLIEATRLFANVARAVSSIVDGFRDLEDISLRNLNKQISETENNIIRLSVELAKVTDQQRAAAMGQAIGATGRPIEEEIKEEFARRAKLIAELQRRENELRDRPKSTPGGGDLEETDAEEKARTREEARRRREQERLATEAEARQREKEDFVAQLMGLEAEEILSFERRKEQLQAFKDEGLISDEQHFLLEREAFRQHQKALTEIELEGLSEREKFTRMKTREQVATVLGGIKDITDGVARQNRVLFEINKIAAIGEATVDAIKGAEKTWDAYPFPINVAMTAIHIAASVARIAALKATQFGGGGSPRRGGHGSAGAATPARIPQEIARDRGADPLAARPRGEMVIRIEGLPKSGLLPVEHVRSLMEQVAEASADGFQVRFSG